MMTRSRNVPTHSNRPDIWDELKLVSCRAYTYIQALLTSLIHKAFSRAADLALFLFVIVSIQGCIIYPYPDLLRANTTNHIKEEQVNSHGDNIAYLIPSEFTHWFGPSGLGSEGFPLNEALNKHRSEGNR